MHFRICRNEKIKFGDFCFSNHGINTIVKHHVDAIRIKILFSSLKITAIFPIYDSNLPQLAKARSLKINAPFYIKYRYIDS